MDGGWESFEIHARKSLDCLEEIVGRNVNIKGNFGESSERKENCRKSGHHLRDTHVASQIEC